MTECPITCRINALKKALFPLSPTILSEKITFEDPITHEKIEAERRFVIGAQVTTIIYNFKKGSNLPVHFHPTEQVTRIEKGLVETWSQGKKYLLGPGDIIIVPPNIPHKFKILEDTVMWDFQSPVRQDLLRWE